MPIAPSKLAAFANPKVIEPLEVDDDLDEEEVSPEPEPEPEEDDLAKFAELLPLLAEYSEDVETCCDELDPDSLGDPTMDFPEDEREILLMGFNEGLERKLQKALKRALSGGISLESAHRIADELEADDVLRDSVRVAGWLFRLAQCL